MTEAEILPWDEGWPQRLQLKLQELGFNTVEEFLRRCPGEPYVEAAKKIAPWVAAMQISRLQMQEAKKQGKMRDAAMDALVRNLNDRLRDGWTSDPVIESKSASAYARTATLISVDGESPELISLLLHAYRAMRDLKPQAGWRPLSPDDLLIRQAFATGWPTD